MGQQVTLKEVRLSFPRLWKAEPYEDGGDPRYNASFIIETNSANHKLIEAAIMAVAKEEWKDKAAAMVNAIRGNPNKCAFIDGNLKPTVNGYPGNFILSANRNAKDGRPLIVDRRGQPLSENDAVIYGGCYVNGIVDIWAQSGQYAGLRCTLMGVQFVKDGESFGGAAKLDPSAFGDLGDMGDEDPELAALLGG